MSDKRAVFAASGSLKSATPRRLARRSTSGRKIDAQASFSPLLTLNYSTTRRPGEDFIKIARVVIAVVQSQRTQEREGENTKEGTRVKEKHIPLKFTHRGIP